MKLKVLQYRPHGLSQVVCGGCHDCMDEGGQKHILDLTTDASFPEFDSAEDKDAFCHGLVGKWITVEHTYPWTPLHFASGVKLHQEDHDPTPWCHVCGAMQRKHCDCPEPFFADNH